MRFGHYICKQHQTTLTAVVIDIGRIGCSIKNLWIVRIDQAKPSWRNPVELEILLS